MKNLSRPLRRQKAKRDLWFQMDFGHLLDKIHEEVAEDPGEMADESSSSDDDVAHENDVSFHVGKCGKLSVFY